MKSVKNKKSFEVTQTYRNNLFLVKTKDLPILTF